MSTASARDLETLRGPMPGRAFTLLSSLSHERMLPVRRVREEQGGRHGAAPVALQAGRQSWTCGMPELVAVAGLWAA